MHPRESQGKWFAVDACRRVGMYVKLFVELGWRLNPGCAHVINRPTRRGQRAHSTPLIVPAPTSARFRYQRGPELRNQHNQLFFARLDIKMAQPDSISESAYLRYLPENKVSPTVASRKPFSASPLHSSLRRRGQL